MTQTLYQKFQVSYFYPVHFTHGVFEIDNKLLHSAMRTDSTNRTLIVVDEGLSLSQPELISKITSYAHHYNINLVAPPTTLVGGEKHKNYSAFENATTILSKANLCRHSFVIAVGGGSFLDIVGLAASLIHRGVRLIRIPTTVLSQNDSGVGVKNGIDYENCKNFLGTFAPPFAVINDFDFLATLPLPYWRGGIAEAFKVAIIKDYSFFEQLEDMAPALLQRDSSAIEEIITTCASLHLNHIAHNGDPFETGSARPLDFGHWAAHKLEALSNYTINHGEAVAIGIGIDTYYAYLQKMITYPECIHIIAAMRECGLCLYHNLLETHTDSLLDGLEEFRIHLGGILNITLPTTIGACREVHTMDTKCIVQAIELLKKECE